jgi:hypothetical protein
MGHPTLHPPCNLDTPAICPGTPDLLSGVSGLRFGLFGKMKLNRQLHIKIILKLKKRLNPFNTDPLSLIQEFIKLFEGIIPWITSLEA